MNPAFLIQCQRCQGGLITLHLQSRGTQEWLVLICHGCDALGLRALLPVPEGQTVPPPPKARRRQRQSHTYRCNCRECLVSL